MDDFDKNLNAILDKYNDITRQLSEGVAGDLLVKLNKEYASLENIVSKVNIYFDIKKEIQELDNILSDSTSEEELKMLAEEEKADLKPKLEQYKKDVQIALIPKDEDDEKNAILEIRAGTGGEEAALFAFDLFSMYQKYAEQKNWKFEILDIQMTGMKGCKEASVIISGNHVFAKLKFESGIHRVQRIPKTESSGRIHTSAATVAVLPEVKDIDIKIEDRDLQIETCRASGAGGQHVNTTDSAVKIIHIPTGITVAQQSERSQYQNKNKALRVLKARLYDFEKQKRDKQISDTRKSQVKSGDRSEKIRTYNFPQSRITDHRINMTFYKFDQVLNGDLDELINLLAAHEQSNKIASFQV